MTCTKCPLHKEGCITNCMRGNGEGGGILFLGEAPGQQEDELGRPFVGRAGKILRALIDDNHLGKYPIRLTNVCRCRPKDNRQPYMEEIRTCVKEHLEREVEKKKPKCIVVLGASAARGIMDDARVAITSLRGSSVRWKGIPVFFTLHPSSVLHDRNNKQYIEADFQKLRKWIKDGYPLQMSKPPAYTIVPWEELARSTNSIAAIDIETSQLDPYQPGGRIVSISACDAVDRVYYQKCNIIAGDLPKVYQLLEPLRKFHTLICHNALFDFGWLTYNMPFGSWLWDKFTSWEDTLVGLQFRDEYYPRTDLGHLGQVFVGMPKLKPPDAMKAGFPKGWKTEQALEELKQYNCRDSVITFHLRKLFIPSDPKERLAYDWVCRNLKVAVQMRHEGIHLDQDRVRRLHRKLTVEIDELERRLTGRGVDIHSDDSLKHHLFRRLRLPVLKKTEKTEEPSMAAPVLEKLVEHDKSGWLKRFLQWRKAKKTRDTYCVGFQKHGAIAHPRIYVAQMNEGGVEGGANTGRITTGGFSNLPRKGPVKKCITSRYGSKGVIWNLDYSQKEVRIMANESKDERLMGAFSRNEDIHTFVAAQLYNCKITEIEADSDERQKGKKVGLGMIYDQQAFSLAIQLGIPKEEAEELVRMYFKRFTGVAGYIEERKLQAVRNKLVHSPIGRPFHLPNAIHDRTHEARKAVNGGIQSGANDFCTEAIFRLQEAFRLEKLYRSHVICTVYDSIIGDSHIRDWKRMLADKSFFQRTCVDLPKQFFAQKFHWMIEVPIKFELQVGPSLGEAQKI